jgi:hypothetical protein
MTDGIFCALQAKRDDDVAVLPDSQAMSRRLVETCANPASGHATAALASPATTLRRPILIVI